MNFINTGLDERILKSMDIENPSEPLVKAMGKQGLVQKEVQVKGKNGKVFTRKQWVKASEAKDSTASQSTMTQDEFNKKYPNGGMQDPVECLKHNGSDATWHGEKLQNPSVMKRAKEEYAQFKKDKAALEAGKSKDLKSVNSTKSQDNSKARKVTCVDDMDNGIKKINRTIASEMNIHNGVSILRGHSGAGETQALVSIPKMGGDVDKAKKIVQEQFSKEFGNNVTLNIADGGKEHPDSLVVSLKMNSSAKNTKELSKRESAQKLSPADAKKKTQEVTKGVSDKKSFMEKVKSQGITWKENDHEGINWMRCCMAMNKHFENGGTFDNSINNSSTTGSSVNTSYTPFSTQTPQSIKDLYGKSKPKSPRLNATHIFETSKKSLADSGKLSSSSLTILKKAHLQVASDNAYQTMLDKYKTGFERDAITGYIGFYIKNDGFGTSSKVDQILDKLSKKYNMSITEVYDKSDKLYDEFINTFDKYQVDIADNEFPEIKYELVSKVNRKYMNPK